VPIITPEDVRAVASAARPFQDRFEGMGPRLVRGVAI
jgi:hypothetical protein